MTTHSDVTTSRHPRHRLAARLAVVGVVGMACLTVLSGIGSSSATSLAGWEIAYQGSNGDLFVVNTATASPSDLGAAMAPNTSPSISSDGAGGYLVAFQGSNGHLETYDTRTGGGALDTQDVMAAGTNPAVTVNTGGSLKIVFHAASGNALSFYTPSNKKTNTPLVSGSPLAMAAGTSPSIAPNNTVGWKVAYQASSGGLSLLSWRVKTPVSLTDQVIRPSMAAGTSPSIASNVGNGFEIAFQSASPENDLMTFLTKSSQTVNSQQPMESGTSPSVVLTNGADEVAFQSSFGDFATYDSRNLLTDTGEAMARNVSPSIASAAGGGWNAAFANGSSDLSVYGAATTSQLAPHSSPSIATNVASPTRSNSFTFYEQDTVKDRECSAVSGDPLVPPSTCRKWSAPPQIIAPGGYESPGDFCLDYGAGVNQLTTPTSADLTNRVGFAAPASNQIEDPKTGTTCSTNGPNSLWGLLLSGSTSTNYCVTNCGLQHVITWSYPNVRPWMGNGQLALRTAFNPVSDNAAELIPQSVWHSYLCPFIRDVSSSSPSTQGFELCEELWRSDHSQVGLCPASEAGANICMSGGQVTTICDQDASGFDECLYPDFTNGYTIAWTRPQAGTRFSTNTGATYQDNNVFGQHLFKVTVTQPDLLEVVRLFNLALSIDQANGLFTTKTPLSTNPSDYAVVIMEDGQEGNAINGSTSATLGANISDLGATSQF